MNDLTPLVQQAHDDFERAHAPADLENAKARYLGKAGRITEQLKALGTLPPDEKKARGALINEAKQAIEAALNARREALADAELQAQLRGEALDVSLPGRRRGTGGGLHPISRARERIEAIFGSMGFDVADGPEIETDWYSFTALNNPENHPARSMPEPNAKPMCFSGSSPMLRITCGCTWPEPEISSQRPASGPVSNIRSISALGSVNGK